MVEDVQRFPNCFAIKYSNPSIFNKFWLHFAGITPLYLMAKSNKEKKEWMMKIRESSFEKVVEKIQSQKEEI
jgi:hypothetical protein